MATAYGLISPSLEEDLGLSTGDIALIGSFGNLGTFSGFVAGYLIDLVGPRRAVFIGSVAIWFGLFFIWLSVSKEIESSVGALCFYIFVAQVGAATMSQSGSSTSMLIVPSESHGTVASLAKAYYGIAGAVLSSIAATSYDGDEKGFILFASIFISVSTFTGGIFLNFIRPEKLSYNNEKKRNIRVSFAPYYQHLIILITAILVCAALYLSDNSGGTQFHQFVGSLVVIWLGCVLLIDHFFFQPSSPNSTASADLAVETSAIPTVKGSVSVNVESMIADEVRAAKSFVHMLEKEHEKAERSKSRGKHSPSVASNSLGVVLLDSEAPHSSQLSEHRAPSMDVHHEIDAMRNISVSIAALVPCKYGPDMSVRPFDIFALS
jgi:MFS family permease